MNPDKLREKYISFFLENGHKEISGKSLIPENDPTVLFTTAGMHPLVPYLLGEPHPAGNRLVNCQKCIRTGDIEAVGDPSHLTFFEMLGNWSLGDYFKEESLKMSYQFLTSSHYLGLDAENLYVTVFEGDDTIPFDEESYNIWLSLGLPEERIFRLPREDNWWGPAGQTGPCGPDSEMFIDTLIAPCSDECKPGCGCGKYFEVWNNVFMQYNKQSDGSYTPLQRPSVDTGMGVERTVTMLQKKRSVFETELFTPILETISSLSGTAYGSNEELDISFRIIADHIKASVMILGDERGVKPSNVEQGYILRRLIRRAVSHGRKLGINKPFLSQISPSVFNIYRDVYPELSQRAGLIEEELSEEEEQFSATLKKGTHEFEKLVPQLMRNPKKVIPGRIVFRLYDTHGLPKDVTKELAAEHGFTIDEEGFDEAFEKHRNSSRQGADGSFAGGLADHSLMTTRYHTATHLLHQALRTLLGSHVEQKGSNITAERLRFDFSHPDKVSDEQLKEIEALVNRKIEANLPVSFKTMSLKEAKELNATALFEGKYEEQVKVYSIGNFSVEVCGGPHTEHTGELGTFKIVKEQSSSKGVRRIKAILKENS